MEDATQHGELGCRNKLECMKEQHPDGIQEPFVDIVGDIDISEELPQQASGLEEILRNVQNRRKIQVDAYLTSQKKPSEADAAKIEKVKARETIKSALKVFLPQWREQMRKDG
jgi:hypothetical protein